MRGHYELSLSDGTKIPMRFCTWSLKRFCQLQGIGPSDISEALSGNESLDAITNLLKAAAEYPLYSQGITPSFTDIEVCDWIDDMGGLGSKKFQDVNTMGECQVLPHLFWDMTMAELDFVWYGYRHKEEQEWLRARWQTSILLNIQLPKGKKIKPHELLPLDCDNRNFVKQRVMTPEELKEVLKKYDNIKK